VSEVISSVASVASCKIQYRFGCGSAAPGNPRKKFEIELDLWIKESKTTAAS
jgi:hypothetical protein